MVFGLAARPKAGRFFVMNVFVVGIAPALGRVAGGTAVVITGTDFWAVTSVTFGGVSATFTFVSGTEIDAVSPAHGAGLIDVQATNLAGTSAAKFGRVGKQTRPAHKRAPAQVS